MRLIRSLLLLTVCVVLVSGQDDWENILCSPGCECLMTEWVAPIPEPVTSWKKTLECRGVSNVSIPDDVQVIKLDGNPRLRISDVFNRLSELKELVELSLTSCEISSIDIHSVSRSLRRLNLNENSLTSLNMSILFNFPNLEELRIEQNNLKTIDNDSFKNSTHLTLLKLDSNHLDSLDWLSKGLKGLRTLILGGNRLKYPVIMNGTFSSLVNLKELILDEMGIRKIEALAFDGLIDLETLDLDGNALQSVPFEIFRSLPKLKYLNMNDNLITQIAEYSFRGMRNIISIELTNQPELRIVDERAFFNLESLERVLLFGNPKLSYVGKYAFVFCPKLTLIDLHNTMIESLDREIVNGLPSLTSIDVKGNPINCNCVIMWFKDWIVDQSTRDKVVCASPPSLRLSRLIDVSNDDFTCAPTVQPTFPLRLVVPDTQRVTLNCRTFGYPEPEIFWFLPSGDVINNKTEAERHQMILEPTGTLTLLKPESGDYACTAENNRGMASRKISIQVLHSNTILSQVNTQPTSTMFENNERLKPDSTSTLKTIVSGGTTTEIQTNKQNAETGQPTIEIQTNKHIASTGQPTTEMETTKTHLAPTTLTAITSPTIIKITRNLSTTKKSISFKTTKENHKLIKTNPTKSITAKITEKVAAKETAKKDKRPIYIPVPKVRVLEVTATSALITWRSPNQFIEFMNEYSPYEMILSLEHNGRIIYTDKVEPIKIFPSWEIESPEYNISLLEPKQTYKVCLIVSCCAPFVRENKYCTLLHTKVSPNHYENVPLAISLTLSIIILIIGFYLLVRCGPLLIKNRWNQNSYIGIDGQREQKFEIPMHELYSPLIQETWETSDTPKQSDRLINTSASTVYT